MTHIRELRYPSPTQSTHVCPAAYGGINGRINVFVGNPSSESQNQQSFTVIGGRPAKVSRRGGRR
jgi:hypothetical protein